MTHVFLNEREYSRLRRTYDYMANLEPYEGKMFDEFFSDLTTEVFAEKNLRHVYKLLPPEGE